MTIDVPCLALTFQKSQNILFPHRTFHVPDDGSRGIIQKFYTNLRDATARASAPKDLYQWHILRQRDDTPFRIQTREP
jgi:hypothetical protein